MPNIPPRGLYARDNGTWKNPVAIFARDAGVWKPAVAVWAMHNGAWQLLWSSTAGSPASVTIAYVTGQVNVSWVAATPAVADTYNIYRPDGSLAGSVAAPTLTFTDLDPRPLNGAYKVFGVLGGAESATGSTSNSLDLRLQAATLTATLVGTTVELAWTPSAVGSPDSWNVYRVIGGVGTLLAPGLLGTTYTDTSPPAGLVNDYRVRPVLSGLEGLERGATVATPPNKPIRVGLTATTTPPANLRLQWDAPTGTVTAYEVETSTDNVTWTPSAVDTSPTDWATTTSTGYMRVRSVAPGGVSVWVTQGPVAAIIDVTPPANATITSWKPEASYGRMVVRFTTPADADLNSYNVQVRVGTGPFGAVSGWVTCLPSTAYAVVVGVYSAGQFPEVKVSARDNLMNQNTGATAIYGLASSPLYVDPSGDLSGTWRGADWRNDATRSINEIATGWTSGGHNIGCFFYGTAIDTALGNKTIASATIEYWRENEGGIGSGVQPLFWTHELTGRTGAPAPNSQGVAESSRLGSAVARTGTTGGSFTLPAAFITALQGGVAKGLCMYRGYVGSGDPDNYYALLSIGGVVGGSPIKVNGRLTFTHLG